MAAQAEVIDIHGESNPAATTVTRLYTSPASGFMVSSKITVCNHGVAGTFRIFTGKNVDDETMTKTRRFYDTPIAVGASMEIVGGDCFRNGGWISVYASHANMSFQIHGAETTIT